MIERSTLARLQMIPPIPKIQTFNLSPPPDNDGRSYQPATIEIVLGGLPHQTTMSPPETPALTQSPTPARPESSSSTTIPSIPSSIPSKRTNARQPPSTAPAVPALPPQAAAQLPPGHASSSSADAIGSQQQGTKRKRGTLKGYIGVAFKDAGREFLFCGRHDDDEQPDVAVYKVLALDGDKHHQPLVRLAPTDPRVFKSTRCEILAYSYLKPQLDACPNFAHIVASRVRDPVYPEDAPVYYSEFCNLGTLERFVTEDCGGKVPAAIGARFLVDMLTAARTLNNTGSGYVDEGIEANNILVNLESDDLPTFHLRDFRHTKTATDPTDLPRRNKLRQTNLLGIKETWVHQLYGRQWQREDWEEEDARWHKLGDIINPLPRGAEELSPEEFDGVAAAAVERLKVLEDEFSAADGTGAATHLAGVLARGKAKAKREREGYKPVLFDKRKDARKEMTKDRGRMVAWVGYDNFYTVMLWVEVDGEREGAFEVKWDTKYSRVIRY